MHAERLKKNGSLDLPPRSAPNKGKAPSEETRKKISESRKGQCIGPSNPFYGRRHDKETMERIRQANLGKEPPNKIKLSTEDVEKIMNDPRGIRKIAADFGVSITVIRRIRRENG